MNKMTQKKYSFKGISDRRRNSGIDWEKAQKIGLIVITVLVIGSVLAYLIQTAPSIKERKPKIAVISVDGTIENFDSAQKIASVAKNSSIEAAVIMINSPGGYVSPSFQLESAISRLSEEMTTVAVIDYYGTSGAYLAATAAEDLYVHHDSVVGGIGVIAVWISLENRYKEEGIEYHVFKTGEHKDMFAPWRSPTENERIMIRNQIHEIENRVIYEITQNRPSLRGNLTREVLTGKTISGYEAVGLDMADNIVLTNSEAIEKAANTAGLREGEYEIVEIG